jgi:phosphomannomutase
MAPERKLFGTDGVRGEAGTFLSAELATSLGRAAAASLPAARPQVLIVRDTRESGPMLEAALAAGIAAAGGDALLGGVLPTPAAARPSEVASSALRNVPASTRTPSVPKSLRSGAIDLS